MAEGIIIKEEDENNVTIDLGVNSKERFNLDKEDESDFDDTINSDEDIIDKNMWLDSSAFSILALIYIFLVNIVLTSPLLL